MAKKANAKTTKSSAAEKTAGKPSKKAVKKATTVKAVPKKSGKLGSAAGSDAKGEERLVKTLLSKEELQKFRAMLLAKRRDIVGDMNGIEAEALRRNRQDGTGDLSNLPTHPADVGTDNFEQEFTLGLLESERIILDEIDEALARIDNETFGICVGTGKPINKARLMARPWAKYCIDYARQIEKGAVRKDSDREAAVAGIPGEDEEEEESYDEPDTTTDYREDDSGEE